MHHNILIFLALIIISSKLLQALFKRINLPPVLGMIIIGLIIGPTCFNLIKSGNDIIYFFANIGVLILLFLAGLETDIVKMQKIGTNTLYIALGGVIIPFLLGFITTFLFFGSVKTALIFGTILSATSVSISVMTLMDIKKLKTVEGNTIVGAAIIDDIIGILILTFLFSFITDSGKPLYKSLIFIFLYLISAIVFGIYFIPLIFRYINKLKGEKILLTLAISIMFLFSWAAELSEVAGITGAYLAGLFIGRTRFRKKVIDDMLTIGHSIFIPIFFVSIGLGTNLRLISKNSLLFAFSISIVAIIGKLFGSGIIAKFIGYNWRRAFGIGSGMVPRGEVALIIASISLKGNLIEFNQFSGVIILVILSAFIAPFLIKYFLKH